MLTRGAITRHIQLKASRDGAATVFQSISTRLAARQAGCVIWMVVDDDLGWRRFLWLGGDPDTPLILDDSLAPARHTKANSAGVKKARPGLRRVPASRFEVLPDIDAVLLRLLGPL